MLPKAQSQAKLAQLSDFKVAAFCATVAGSANVAQIAATPNVVANFARSQVLIHASAKGKAVVDAVT